MRGPGAPTYFPSGLVAWLTILKAYLPPPPSQALNTSLGTCRVQCKDTRVATPSAYLGWEEGSDKRMPTRSPQK